MPEAILKPAASPPASPPRSAGASPARLSPLDDPAATAMGATLRFDGRGAAFRVWAPRARRVHLVGGFGGREDWAPTEANRLFREADGRRWSGFHGQAREGDPYKFWIEGDGSEGFKRDPYARELSTHPPYPNANCLIRSPARYRWRAKDWRPPAFTDLILYQLHVGTFHGPDRPNRVATLLDVALRLDYLADLGVTGLQLLPVVEFSSPRSLGYDGSDLFSPEMDYTLEGDEALGYLPALNARLAALGQPPLDRQEILAPADQLKILVDLAHLHGIAVLLDVVYNHAGFQIKDQDESLWFFDRETNGDPNRSLYFTDRDHTGPVFAYWNADVRQFLIDNAVFFLTEFRCDGLRYDQTSVIDVDGGEGGRRFLRDVTDTTRFVRPETIQIAEYWPRNPNVTAPRGEGGYGFDATWSDGLREALRGAVAQASGGEGAFVDIGAVARELTNPGFRDPWRAVNCVESHDEVYVGREPRVARLADGVDPRSWHGRSRSRAALSLLLAAPGIPMIFMGQEILEDRTWSDNAGFHREHLVDWSRLDSGDRASVDLHRCCREMIATRRRLPALREGAARVFHVDEAARLLALHRWLEGGEDVVVLFTLAERTRWRHRVGLPRGGRWAEVFNSDVHDHWVNPWAAGNGGAVQAEPHPADGFGWSAEVVVPANAVIVLAAEG